MRKRTQDGYVLVFVLVVILVVLALCGVACTAAMRNLKSQQASIEDLQSKLDAAGNVEKAYGILANLKTKTWSTYCNGDNEESKGSAVTDFETCVNTSLDGIASVGGSTYDLDEDTLVIMINVSVSREESGTQVDAALKLEATLQGVDSSITVTPEPTVSPAPEPEVEKHTTWTLTGVKVSYDSYHVSTAEGEGDSP